MTCNHSQEGTYIACVHCDIEHATLAERERITAWIEDNRSGIEFEPGEVIYRDHFTSESLLTFINGENK